MGSLGKCSMSSAVKSSRVRLDFAPTRSTGAYLVPNSPANKSRAPHLSRPKRKHFSRPSYRGPPSESGNSVPRLLYPFLRRSLLVVHVCVPIKNKTVSNSNTDRYQLQQGYRLKEVNKNIFYKLDMFYVFQVIPVIN